MMAEEGKEKKEAEKPPIKAVIFDLDGLLIDSEPIWHNAYEIFLKNHGVSNNPEVYNRMIGRGLKENMMIARDELRVKGDVKDLLNQIRNIFYNLLSNKKNILMAGALDLLQKLNSYRFAVATGGHTKERCSQILKNIGIYGYFEVIVSSDDVKSGKPEPYVYIETAKQLGVKPLSCLVLEDAVNGVLAAKEAGMKVFGINREGIIRSGLEKAGADKVYSSLEEVEL